MTSSVAFGTCLKPFPSVHFAAHELAAALGEELQVESYVAYAGDNQYVSLLLDPDTWLLLVEWAAPLLASGGVGYLGKQLAERFFPSKLEGRIEQIERINEARHTEVIEKFSAVISALQAEAGMGDRVFFGTQTEPFQPGTNEAQRPIAGIELEVLPHGLSTEEVADLTVQVAVLLNNLDKPPEASS